MPFPLTIPFDRQEMRQDRQSRTDLQSVYQGFAPPDTATNQNRWTIYAYTFDSLGFITRRQIVTKFAWDSRTDIVTT